MENNQENKIEIKEFDIKCPICGTQKYASGVLQGKFLKTVFRCYPRNGKICDGKIVYCKKCEKWYPFTNFGFHADAYECKTCGTVQWEYTDVMKREDYEKQVLSSVKRNIKAFY